MIVAREGMLYLAPLVALLGGALLVFSNARHGRLLALLSAAAAFLFTVGIVARPGTLLLSGSEETGLLLYAGGPGLIFGHPGEYRGSILKERRGTRFCFDFAFGGWRAHLSPLPQPSHPLSWLGTLGLEYPLCPRPGGLTPHGDQGDDHQFHR